MRWWVGPVWVIRGVGKGRAGKGLMWGMKAWGGEEMIRGWTKWGGREK